MYEFDEYMMNDPLYNIKLRKVVTEPNKDTNIDVVGDEFIEIMNNVNDEKNGMMKLKVCDDDDENSSERNKNENKTEVLSEKDVKDVDTNVKHINDEKCMMKYDGKVDENWLKNARKNLKIVGMKTIKTPQKKKIYTEENLHMTPGSSVKKRKLIRSDKKSFTDIKKLWEKKTEVCVENKKPCSKYKSRNSRLNLKKILSNEYISSSSMNVQNNGLRHKQQKVLDNWIVRTSGVGNRTTVKENDLDEKDSNRDRH